MDTLLCEIIAVEAAEGVIIIIFVLIIIIVPICRLAFVFGR